MKKLPWRPGDAFAWLWYVLLQPALFLFSVAVFVIGMYQSFWS